jgi:hypothetical protein
MQIMSLLTRRSFWKPVSSFFLSFPRVAWVATSDSNIA